jgi:hypothetical protein
MGPLREPVDVLNGPPPTEDGDDDDVGDEPYFVSYTKIRQIQGRKTS